MQQPQCNRFSLNRPIRPQNQNHNQHIQQGQSYPFDGQRNNFGGRCGSNDYRQPRPPWNDNVKNKSCNSNGFNLTPLKFDDNYNNYNNNFSNNGCNNDGYSDNNYNNDSYNNSCNSYNNNNNTNNKGNNNHSNSYAPRFPFARHPPSAQTPPPRPGFQKKMPSKSNKGINVNKGNAATQEKSETTFRCEPCKQDFKAEHSLRLHESRHTKTICRCEPCNQDFKSQYALLQHETEHRKCVEDGCDFIASVKYLQLHYIEVHDEGKLKLQVPLDGPEDIAKWREERKRNWPTEQTIEAKKKKLAADKEDGILVKTKEFVYRERGGRGRGRGKGRDNRGIHSKNTSRNQKYRHDKEKSEETNVEEHLDENKTPSDNSAQMKPAVDQAPALKPNIIPIQNENQTDSVTSDCCPSSAETSQAQPDSLPTEGHTSSHTRLKSQCEAESTSCDANNEDGRDEFVIVSSTYKEDGEINDDNSAAERFLLLDEFSTEQNLNVQTKKVSGPDAGLIKTSAADVSCEKEEGELDTEDDTCEAYRLVDIFESSKKVDSVGSKRKVTTKITNEMDQQSKDCSDVIENENETNPLTWKEKRKRNKQKKKKVQYEATKAILDKELDTYHGNLDGEAKKDLAPWKRQNSPPPSRRVALLEMLLANEIRHERNVVLQCIRYIVKNNFFQTS